MRLPVGQVKSNPNNPRLIKDDKFKKLVQSIKDFPEMAEVRPIVVNKDNVILGGNMRFKAMKEAGWTEVPVRVVDWSEDKQREFIIKDNVAGGEWDWEILANEWDREQLEDWGLDVAEWASDEVQEDEAPEISQEPAISQLGEVYQLGRHRLMCGDSTKIDDVQTLMAGKKADMVFTDPPYNIGYEGGANSRRTGILNDKMSKTNFYDFLYDAFSNLMVVNNGAFYLFMGHKEIDTLKVAFEQAGGHFQSFIIWVKNRFTLSGADYQNQYEVMLYGWVEGQERFFISDRGQGAVWYEVEKKARYYDDKTEIKVGTSTLILNGKVTGIIQRGKRKTDIWEHDRPNESKEHPTMKPVRLITEAIRNSSKDDQIVLDVFGGSGSTLIACEQTNRTCYMCELDEKYCDVIRKRYWKFTHDNNEEGWIEGTAAIN